MRIFLSSLLLAGLTVLTAALPCPAADEAKLEPGFTLLFNGKDLTGWKNQKGGVSLDGQTETADKRFKVQDGNLVIDAAVKGNVVIETAQPLSGDVHIKFDYLPGKGCNNDLYFHGLKFDIKSADVKNLKEGEWNEFEIVRQGSNVEFKSNGQTQKTFTAKADSTPLGIRAEFGPIQYRRIRVKQGS